MRENALKFEIIDTVNKGKTLATKSKKSKKRAKWRDRLRDAGLLIRFVQSMSFGEEANRIFTLRGCFFEKCFAVACAYMGAASDANPYDWGA